MPRAAVSKKKSQIGKQQTRNSRKRKSNRRHGLIRGVDSILSSIYYLPENPASFSSPLRLYNAAAMHDSRLRLGDVVAWLEKQPTYTLNREIKLKFPTRKVVVSGKGVQYQADLVEYTPIQKENDGNRYLLTMIDCFSRLATAVPMPRKKKEECLPALKVAFDDLGGAPQKLQTDNGSEFYNGLVSPYLESKGVKHFSSKNMVKAQIVERFNRTLRTKIQHFMVANNTLRYIDVLPKILFGYNNAVHSSLIDYTPSQVTLDNEKEVFEKQYRPYLNSKKTQKKPKFKVGETVRISSYRGPFYKKTTSKNFTSEVFTIVNVLHTIPTTYQVIGKEDTEAIEGTFYEAEIQKVRND